MINQEYGALRDSLSPYLERKYDQVAREFRSAIRHSIDEAETACIYGFEHSSSSTGWDEYIERLAQQSQTETRSRIDERWKTR